MSLRKYSACTGALALCVLAACSKSAPPRRQTIPVSVTVVKRAIIPFVVSANGVAEPMQTVAVEAQVSGILNAVTFAEGANVTVGQVLFQIDARPYAAALAQARAQLARDEAIAANARRDAARYGALVKEGYVTGSQADQAEATAASAAATVAAARAAVSRAAIDLANTTIRAPISGRTGSLLVRQGNLVRSTSQPPLVVINQIQPILVRLRGPPEPVSGHPEILSRRQRATGSCDSFRGHGITARRDARFRRQQRRFNHRDSSAQGKVQQS
jgi:membrane fusion protein, multidrug efflux system